MEYTLVSLNFLSVVCDTKVAQVDQMDYFTHISQSMSGSYITLEIKLNSIYGPQGFWTHSIVQRLSYAKQNQREYDTFFLLLFFLFISGLMDMLFFIVHFQ